MIVESWSAGTWTLYTSVRFLIFLYRLKTSHVSDGWRKTTEVHHRTEQSKYGGSLFNLAVRSDIPMNGQSFAERVIGLLSNVFNETPETHFSLTWERFAIKRVPNNFSDFTHVTFSGDGAVESMAFYPGSQYPLSPAMQSVLPEILAIVGNSYNLTKDLPDKKRPRALWKGITKKIARDSRYQKNAEINGLAMRILSSSWINFLDTGGDQESRNRPHWFYRQKNSGFGLINIHCRHSSEFTWMDIWMQVSHTGMDGRAAGKLQQKIKKKMGLFDDSLHFPESYPVPGNMAYFQVPGQNVFNGCCFTDFTGFIQETNALSAEYGKILPVAMLIWGLSAEPSFRGLKFNVPVDVPANDTHDRTVGFVFTKPQYFRDRFPGDDAFRKYIDDFNDQVKGVRNRTANNYYFLESSLMAPHWMLILMLKYMRPALYSLTGGVCVTIMEGLEYGIPSLSDNVDSIISITLPVGSEKLTGCVSVKSSSDNIKSILEAVRTVAESPVPLPSSISGNR